VDAPSFSVVVPMGRWALDGSLIVEQVSGASPRYYSDISGATVSPGMKDKRTGADVKLTRYFERASLGVGVTGSTENDYRSGAFSLDGRVSTDDLNTTFNFGVGVSDDRINPQNGSNLHEKRRTGELAAGVTRVLTRYDIGQLNVTYSQGSGYYSDPYKLFDNRPSERKQASGLLRWNHHFAGLGSTLRSGYRYYRDSFGISAHTLDAAWVQPLGQYLSLTPLVRYYTQSAARFYYDPVTDINVYPGYIGTLEHYSADQRLSAFGAVTVGLKAEMRFGRWTTDAKVEQYEQRSDWRLGGKGSPNLDAFHATIFQLGVGTNF
jgi:hypothetical protein